MTSYHMTERNLSLYAWPLQHWVKKEATRFLSVSSELSNEKDLGWLFDIGDVILPSCMGIVKNHYKDPY